MNFGGGGGGGGGGMIIILVLCCCFMVVMGLTGYWTCTGGTFDNAFFDSAKCLQIPGGDMGPADDDDDGDDEDDSTGGNNMDTPSWDSSNPGDIDLGEDYLLCVGTIFPNDARTCYNSAEEGAGIRWVWSDNPEATACQQKVAKWRIDVTSDFEQHLKVYTHYINTGTASSFSFNNAPSGFVTNTFVRFRISAIDQYGELLMPSVNIELDASTSTSTCGDVGISDPVDFNDLETSSAVSENLTGEDVHLPPPLEDPVDCTGGSWVAVGDCKVDGAAVNIMTCGPSCTQEYELQGYTPAEHGGECVTSKFVQIDRESCAVYVADPAIDCVMSPYWTDATSCSATCGGGKKTQIRDIITDEENGGQACGATSREIDCNTQECPVNCVGQWTTSGDSYWISPTPCGKTKKKQDWVYTVTTSPNAYGTACPYANGDTRTLNAEPEEEKTRRCKGH